MLTCFLHPCWLWNPSCLHSWIGQWYKLSVSCFSRWRRFGFGDTPSISDQLTLHFLLILPSVLEHLANRIDDKQRNCIYLFVFPKACPYLPALITIVQNSWHLDATKLVHIAMQNKMVRNVFPNHQIRNNMFHSHIGTRNKTVLNGQFGNNVFHWKIGTRTKTALIYQFGNNVFHWEIQELGTKQS